MSRKKALLIGINYILDSRNKLNGCINDAKNMAKYLRDVQGFAREDITLVTDESVKNMTQITYDGIVQLLYELCISSWRDNLTLAVFHYSGHGSQQEDMNNDEVDGLDEGLVPIDFDSRGMISDDLLNKIFKMFNPKTKVVVFVDACHSGSILDITPAEGLPSIICLSGCRDNQTSADIFDPYTKQAGGAMTGCLLKLLAEKGSVAYHVHDLVQDLNNLLGKRGYDQRSELSYANSANNLTILF
jgi:hypothetical protein